MNLQRFRIKNYRSYRDSGWISADDKTVIVGENNAGKSNILRALDMFFDVSPTKPHNLEDSHNQDGDEIRLIGEFTNLTEEELEAFEEYVHDGCFRLTTVYPFGDDDAPESKEFAVQRKIPANENFRDPDDKYADDLKEIYDEHEPTLSNHRPDDWSGKHGKYIKETIKNYVASGEAETKLEERTDPSSLAKKDLRAHLPNFEHFESDRDIEDETRTSTTALLGKLLNDALDDVPSEDLAEIDEALDRVETRLNEDDKFDEITDLEDAIRAKLNQQIPLDDLTLRIDVPNRDDILRRVSVSVDDGVETSLSTMGSGMHTSFILSCLWELSERDTDEQDVIFGLEEPENDLHPHAQRQLFDTLNELSEGDYQIFLSTHSAHLIDEDDLFDTVRVEKQGTESTIHRLSKDEFTDEDLYKVKSKMTAENTEMFFSRATLLCEGDSELQALPILNAIIDQQSDKMYAFDRLGISVIDTDGKNGMRTFLNFSDMFNIPSVVLVDNDNEQDPGHEELVNEYREKATEVVKLPDDFEQQFFENVELEQFCHAMQEVCDYENSPESIRKGVRNSDKNVASIMRDEFERCDPSKPKFGKALAQKLSTAQISDEMQQVMEKTRRVALHQ
jgi:predicted ATP-dependent endonuclease of OLD family